MSQAHDAKQDRLEYEAGSTSVVIQRGRLSVNQSGYGVVRHGDRILVDRDKVFVNGRPRMAVENGE